MKVLLLNGEQSVPPTMKWMENISFCKFAKERCKKVDAVVKSIMQVVLGCVWCRNQRRSSCHRDVKVSHVVSRRPNRSIHLVSFA